MSGKRERLLLALTVSALIDEGDEAGAARAITEAALDGLGVERCGVWRMADDGRSMRCTHLCDRAAGPDADPHRDTLDLALSADAFPRYFAALARERAIVADDAPRHPATAEFAHGYLDGLGITSLLDCPIRQHGRMVGILCAEHRGPPRTWTAADVTFLASLADLFGRALTAAERRDYRQRLEALNAALEERVAERTAELRAALDYLDKARHHLVEREKLAALGQLVAGVAHEINTPVGVIVTATSHCQGLLGELRTAQAAGTLSRSRFEDALAELDDGLAMALRNAERAATLVESFKRTAADQTHDVRSRFDLGQVLADVLAALQPLLRRRGVRTELSVTPGIACDSYAGSLAQVLTNLVMNAAVHAWPEGAAGGAIAIRAGQEGPRAWLRVEDDGAGMAPEVLRKAFEPFFTTARTRGGTGLGLSIVRTLVEQTLGGEIRIDSTPGGGCRVEVRFPRRAPG
ncbi:MAG TPA: diguanylate cyclase [Xanthomonadaceae bacterium]|nr:diguanylate cyclase [Xanthomonadaceae bacterium]